MVGMLSVLCADIDVYVVVLGVHVPSRLNGLSRTYWCGSSRGHHAYTYTWRLLYTFVKFSFFSTEVWSRFVWRRFLAAFLFCVRRVSWALICSVYRAHSCSRASRGVEGFS